MICRLVALLAAAIVVGRCQGASDDASTVITYRAEVGLSLPVPIQQPAPVYSSEAQRANYQAIVRVSLVVGLDGIPEDIEVVQSAGLGLDEKTIDVLRRWRFRPGMKDGHAVRVAAAVDVNFRTRPWRVVQLDSDTPPNAVPPVPIRQFTNLVGETCGEVVVLVQIPPDGVPAEVRVISTTNAAQNQVAVELATAWRFEPAKQNGAHVASSIKLKFVCEPWPTTEQIVATQKRVQRECQSAHIRHARSGR